MAISVPTGEREVLPSDASPGRAQAVEQPGSFGGGPRQEEATAAITQIPQSAGEIAAYEMNRADQTAIIANRNKMSNLALEGLYGYDGPDGTHVPGALERKGLDASQAVSDSLDHFDKGNAQLMLGVKDPKQRTALMQMAVQTRDELNRNLHAHAYSESEKYGEEQFNTSLTNEAHFAALNRGDQDASALHISNGIEIIKKRAQTNGLPPEWTESVTDKFVAESLKSIFEGHIQDGNIAMAKKVLDDHKYNPKGSDEDNQYAIKDPKVTDEMQKTLDIAAPRLMSAYAVAGAMQKANGDPVKAGALIDKMPESTDLEVKIKDAAKKRLEENGRINLDLEAQQKHELYNQASDMISQAQKQGRIITGKTSINDIIPDTLRNKLEPAQIQNLNKKYVDVQGDEGAWQEYSHLSTEDKHNLTQDQRDFYEARAGVHSAEFNKIQRSADTDKALSMSNDDFKKTTWEAAVTAGIVPKNAKQGKLVGDQVNAYSSFESDIRAEIASNKLATGRDLTSKEQEKIIEQHAIDRMGNQSSWNSAKNSFRSFVGMDNVPFVKYEDIPSDARQHLLEFAERDGKTLTKDEVERLYPYYQSKDLPGLRKAMK